MNLRSKIFTQFNPSDLFDKWYEETSGEDNFAENMGLYNDEEERLKNEAIEEFTSDNNISMEDFDETSPEFNGQLLF